MFFDNISEPRRRPCPHLYPDYVSKTKIGIGQDSDRRRDGLGTISTTTKTAWF
jgi:hypothetical protein